jgi:hypothetical protein
MSVEREGHTRPRRIAVVGMGRSGTTFAIDLLGRLGVFLDSVNWASEHEDARAINDGYLEQFFGARPGRPYGRLPQGEIRIEDPAWRARVDRFVHAMDERCDRAQGWAFKDPRTTILWDMWSRHFDVVVGVYRAPMLVADSYLSQKWISGPFPRRVAIEYWLRFNRSLVWIADHPAPAEFFLVEIAPDFPAQAYALADRLELDWDEGALDSFDPGRQVRNGAVDPRRTRAVYAALHERRLLAP